MGKKEEFEEQLPNIMAGETIDFRHYERFNIGALPKTLSTLMEVNKAEATMEAVQDKALLTPRQMNIVKIMTMGVLALILMVIARNLGLF